jgi:pantetheine-phosphate adenylyltransferase
LEYLFLSSSIVKEIARFGRDISNFVPPQILNDIQSRLKSNSK